MQNLKIKIEDLSNVLGEVGDVGIKGAVIHSKETNLVVLKGHELREVGRADLVQVVSCSASPARAAAVLFR